MFPAAVIQYLISKQVLVGSLETYPSLQPNLPKLQSVHHIPGGNALNQIKIIRILILSSGDCVQSESICIVNIGIEVRLDFAEIGGRLRVTEPDTFRRSNWGW